MNRDPYDAENFDPEKLFDYEGARAEESFMENLYNYRYNRPKDLTLSKFRWSVLICLCVNKLTASQFLRAVFIAQVMQDLVMILSLSVGAFAVYLFEPWAIFANFAPIPLMFISGIVSCVGSNLVSSGDLRIRYKPNYNWMLIAPLISSIVSTLILLGTASILGAAFVARIIFNVTWTRLTFLNPGLAVLFAFMAGFAFILSLFTLSQAIMRCIGCSAATQIRRLKQHMEYQPELGKYAGIDNPVVVTQFQQQRQQQPIAAQAQQSVPSALGFVPPDYDQLPEVFQRSIASGLIAFPQSAI